MEETHWVDCPKCGNAISRNSIQCPTCGINAKEHFDANIKEGIQGGIVFIIATILLGCIGFLIIYALNSLEYKYGIGLTDALLFTFYIWVPLLISTLFIGIMNHKKWLPKNRLLTAIEMIIAFFTLGIPIVIVFGLLCLICVFLLSIPVALL